MSNKFKAYKTAHNRRTKTLAHRVHGGVATEKFSKAPKFYQKQKVQQNQRLFAEFLKRISMFGLAAKRKG